MRNEIIKYLYKEQREINTRSQEEYNELMEYLDFYKFIWQDGEKITKSNCYKYNKEKTLILLQEWYEIAFNSIDCNKKEEFSIITFQDFKKEFIEKDIAYQLHLAKKHVEALEKQLREETKKYYARFKLKENNFNYLKYNKNEETYGIDSNWENKSCKTKFTQKELKELNVWDNPLFEIEKVED